MKHMKHHMKRSGQHLLRLTWLLLPGQSSKAPRSATVQSITLEKDEHDGSLTWLILEPGRAPLRACLAPEAVESLADMLGDILDEWNTCPCETCTVIRTAREVAGRLH